MSGVLILIGFALLLALVYAAECWWFPFRRCHCPFKPCEGGRHYSKDRKHHRDCWWCKGTGRRLRFGRRIYNLIESKRRATQPRKAKP